MKVFAVVFLLGLVRFGDSAQPNEPILEAINSKTDDFDVLETLLKLKDLMKIANSYDTSSPAAGHVSKMGTVIDAAQRLNCFFGQPHSLAKSSQQEETTTTTSQAPAIAHTEAAPSHKEEKTQEQTSALNRLSTMFKSAFSKVKTHLKPTEIAAGLKTVLDVLDTSDDKTIGQVSGQDVSDLLSAFNSGLNKREIQNGKATQSPIMFVSNKVAAVKQKTANKPKHHMEVQFVDSQSYGQTNQKALGGKHKLSEVRPMPQPIFKEKKTASGESVIQRVSLTHKSPSNTHIWPQPVFKEMKVNGVNTIEQANKTTANTAPGGDNSTVTAEEWSSWHDKTKDYNRIEELLTMLLTVMHSFAYDRTG